MPLIGRILNETTTLDRPAFDCRSAGPPVTMKPTLHSIGRSSFTEIKEKNRCLTNLELS